MESGLLRSIRRHISLVVLIGPTVFAAAPTGRLDIIKVALTVVAAVGGVVAYCKQRISESVETRERVKLLNERFGAACAPPRKTPARC